MAVLATQNPTLLDLANALGPDNNIAVVVEILNETNEILQDWVMIEGNLPTGHRTTIRTGIPEPTWRQMYKGVNPTKSTRATITDTTGSLEAYAEVDKKLADLGGNAAAFRLSEDRAHIEGMAQTAAETLFYGNEALNPERFTGLAPRFSDLSAESGVNIIDAGGTGSDNASIWLIGWGDQTCHGIYPNGQETGLFQEDLGEDTKVNPDGSMFQVYRTRFEWNLGLTVRDWRYVVRIANIDRSDLNSDGSGSSAVLHTLMFRALERLPSETGANFAFYMDRTVRTFLREQTAAAVNQSTLTTEQIGGVRVTSFENIPVRRCDALAINEARVV